VPYRGHHGGDLMRFGPEQLALLGETGEVEIETRQGDRRYRTVIWIVVDDGEVFVRSVRGDTGKWYQRALANPEVAIHVGETLIPARAVPAEDDETVERVNRALGEKYRPGGSLNAMLRPDVQEDTLRLEPV
jgi:hypothetical protein